MFILGIYNKIGTDRFGGETEMKLRKTPVAIFMWVPDDYFYD
jgi:hypothetical protein